MLKIFRDAFAARASTGEADEPRPELATAALLVHAARSDHDYAEVEQATIAHVLADAFSLSDAEAATLREEGEKAEAAATDIVRFTRVLKDALDEDARALFLERVWRVVLADDARAPDENAFMRRLAALLYVPDPVSNAARLRAAAGDA